MIYILGLVALGLAWLLPGHYRPWTSFQQELLAATGAALVVLAAVARPGARTVDVPPIALGLAIVATVPLVQWAMGQIAFFDDAVLPAMYLVGAGLVIVAARSMTSSEEDQFVTAVNVMFIAAALASSVVALAQWLQVTDGLWVETAPPGARVYANLTQANHLASAVALGAIALAWCYETQRIGAWSAICAWTIFALVLALTGSRTGWLLVSILAVSVMWARRRRLAVRTPVWAVVAASLSLVLAVLLMPSLNEWLLLSPSEAALSGRLQVGTRSQHWQTIAEAVALRPVFGYGWNQVSAAQQAAAAGHPAVGEWLVHSHNLVLDMLVYNGVVLGGLIVCGVAAWLVTRLKGCRDASGWSAITGCVALLVHALLEYPLHYLFFLLPMAILVGIVEARHESSTVLRVNRAWLVLPLLTLVALGVRVAQEYLEVEDVWRRVQLHEAGFVTDGIEPRPPDVKWLEGPREIIRFQLTEAREGMTPEELDWMLAVRKRYAQPGAFIRYAVAAGLNGRADDARQSLVLLCKIWGDGFCDRARKSWPDYQVRHPALKAIAFPVPAAR